MNITQLKLRQKLLLLIVGVGGIGLATFTLNADKPPR
jgi:hypothetical protein